MDEDELASLDELGYDQIAAYFSDKALELEAEFPHLLTPLLYASKSVLRLGELNSRKSFSAFHMEKWRMNVSWMTHAAGVLREEVARLDSDVKDLKSDLQKESFKYLVQSNIKISDEKMLTRMRQNAEFRTADRQLSVLRAILTTVLDHCDQYKLIKDVLVQESTLIKRQMDH